MLARAKRDYYAVLGVPRDADRDAIKRAYRALAAELHPDVSSEPDAAQRFHELAEAYEVLSRPESRARYDRLRPQRGAPGRTASAGTRRDMGGGSRAPGPKPGERGADVVLEAELGFAEAARGTWRDVSFASTDLCPDCLGIGRVAARGCGRCGGTGRVRLARSLSVRVPAGARDGQELRYAGEGHPGGTGAAAGDVVVRLRVRPAPDSPLLRRLAAAGVACAVALAVAVALLS